MKIRVQGYTIDTEDIRVISDITADFDYGVSFLFRINLMDSKEVLVRHNIDTERIYITGYEHKVCLEGKDYSDGIPFNSKSAAIEYVKLLPLYKEEYNRIKTLCDMVIVCWSNNQSKIPNLEII